MRIFALLLLTALACSAQSPLLRQFSTTNYPVANPHDFGATGDGFTDDTAALQSLFNSGRKNIYLSEGVYLTSGNVVWLPCSISGPGILKMANNSDSSSTILIISNTTGVTISGLTFDGNVYGQSVWSEHRHAIRLWNATNTVISQAVFTNLCGDGVYISHALTDVAPFAGSDRVLISACSFLGSNTNRNGVSIICARNVTIEDSTFIGMARAVMPGAIVAEQSLSTEFIYNVKISHNTIRSSAVGVIFSNTSGCPSSGVNISENDISGSNGQNPNGIIVVSNNVVVISGNRISACANPAIETDGALDVVIMANSATNCGNGFQAVNCPGVRVLGNSAYGTTAHVIGLYSSTNAIVGGNVLSGWDASHSGIALLNSGDGTIYFHNFLDGLGVGGAGVRVGPGVTNTYGSENQIVRCTKYSITESANKVSSPVLWDDSSGHPTASGIVTVGSLSVGTATPWIKQTIVGASSSPSLATHNANGLLALNSGTGATELAIGNLTGSPYSTWFQVRGDNDGASYPLSFNPLGGLVGIGTTSPWIKETVVGTASSPSLSSHNANGLLSLNSGSAQTELVIGNMGVSPYSTWLQARGDNDSLSYPIALNPLGGNVGVGTTNPAALLHVAGTAVVTNFFISAPSNGVAPTTVSQPIGLFACLHLETTTNTVQMTNNSTYSVLTNWSSVETNGFTANKATGFLTNLTAGFYRVTSTLTMFAGNADTLEMEVWFNASGQESLSAFHAFDNPSRVDSFSVAAIMYIPANTGISLRIRNNTDTDAATVWRASLSVGTP